MSDLLGLRVAISAASELNSMYADPYEEHLKKRGIEVRHITPEEATYQRPDRRRDPTLANRRMEVIRWASALLVVNEAKLLEPQHRSQGRNNSWPEHMVDVPHGLDHDAQVSIQLARFKGVPTILSHPYPTEMELPEYQPEALQEMGVRVATEPPFKHRDDINTKIGYLIGDLRGYQDDFPDVVERVVAQFPGAMNLQDE